MPFPMPSLPTYPLPVAELAGRLFLAQLDVAQRLQYLACRLSVGVMESYLRRHLLRRDDTFYAADQAEQEERIGMLMEASGEGLVTILGAYIEELTQAQVRCVEGSFRGIDGDAVPRLGRALSAAG